MYATLLKMRVNPPITVALVIGLAGLVSVVRANHAHDNAAAQAQIWAKTATDIRQGAAVPDKSAQYWSARVPGKNPMAVIEEMGAWPFWSAGAGQEVWGVNVAAGIPPQDVPADAIPLIAMSTASFLGIDLPDTEDHFEPMVAQAVGSLGDWRSVLLDQCGACAPMSSPLPPVRDMWTPTTLGPSPIRARSATLAAERIRRSAIVHSRERQPLVVMMARIRTGGIPTIMEWNTRGMAGMAALELAMANRTDQLDEILDCARRGPSRTDQIAALWAARAMGSADPMIDQVVAAL